MYSTFRRPAAAKTVMFTVGYEDGRTAYLWIEDHPKTGDHLVDAIAKERQEQGVLPPGTITRIRRVR